MSWPMNDRLVQLTTVLIMASMMLAGCSGEADDPVEISGCMDVNAENYDEYATLEGVCEYADSDGDGISDMDEIPGCVDEEATNYDSSATDDDGSCTYPPASQYNTSWSEVEMDKPCQCSDGSNYSVWHRDASQTRVVLYFQGGGACWNDLTCAVPGGTYKTDTGEWDDPSSSTQDNYSSSGGIFNFANRDNPLIDYSFIYVPYCTGDIHVGNNNVTYGHGEVQHRGHVNAMSAYELMRSLYPNASEIFVAGSSAGSIPATLYAMKSATDYPNASISAFNDATGGLLSTGRVDLDTLWSINETMADFSLDGLISFNNLTSADLVIVPAVQNLGIKFARYDNANDNTIRYFNGLLDNPPFDYNEQVRITENEIEEAGVDISGFIAPGDGHTALINSRFYELEVEGHSFLEWFTSFVEGGQPDDVHCTEC